MSVLRFAAGPRRLVLAVAFVLALIGLAAWFGMIRQEDPSFPYRAGFVLVAYPGADPERVERLVLEPLEEELAEIEEIDYIQSTVRTGQATLRMRFKDYVYDTETQWDRVRNAVRRAEQQDPADGRGTGGQRRVGGGRCPAASALRSCRRPARMLRPCWRPWNR